jgi:DNA-binding XRE family transcriptional regulator
VVSHVNDDVRRGIERAIAAIAAAVHLSVCVRNQKHREHRLKKFLFHRFSFYRVAFDPAKTQHPRQARSVVYSLHLSPMLPAKIRQMRHDIAKQFGQRVRKARLERELSQETLAAKADIDRAFLSGIERGVENPTLFTIQAIADALETGVGNLMKGI